MNYAELQVRLTGHLGSEASYDFHTLEARKDAIQEAYETISDQFEVWAGVTADVPYSEGARPNAQPWNVKPPPLTADSDMPWSGGYPDLHRIITLYAAYVLYRDKGPEAFQSSLFWKSAYDDAAKRIKERMERKAHGEFMDKEGEGDTWEGLQTNMRFYLGTSGMDNATAFRMFPDNIRSGAIRRAYREITEECELTVKTFTSTNVIPVNGAKRIELPSDFLRPLSEVAFDENGTPILGARFPFGGGYTPAATYSYVREGDTDFLQLSNSKRSSLTLSLRYVAKPTALDDPSDKPWGGLYPTGNKLILLRAMRDMMRGKPETYNMSRFWENEYEREVRAFKRTLKRYDGAQADRVFMGHVGESNVGEGFIPINYDEGNGGNR